MFAKDEQGAVKALQSNFNGVGDMIVPGDGDGTEPRAKVTDAQNSIYEQPNNKIIFQDLAGDGDVGTPDESSASAENESDSDESDGE